MNSQMKSKLKHLLVKHEDERLFPYLDTKDKITIGIGRNLTDCGLRKSECDFMFDNDIEYFYFSLNEKYPWFCELNEARQIALVDMCFMGVKELNRFERMLHFLSINDYDNAANEISDSDWSKEVGSRSKDIEEIIRTGELN